VGLHHEDDGNGIVRRLSLHLGANGLERGGIGVNTKARTRLLIATGVIVAVFVVGVVYVVSREGAYYRQVSELAGGEYVGKNVKVGGRVLSDGLAHDDSGFVFDIQDLTGQADTVKVEYDGQVPDTFGPGADVVVLGTYSESAAGGLITASQVQTKCPSKYEGAGTTPTAAPAP
jgi:cytochrome c-type biogenesis protein CcmE